MWKTALLLLFTLAIIPFAFYLDEPLTDTQLEILYDLILIYLFASSACFIISTLTDNYSQVDKLWSTIPVVYVWFIASRSGFEPRPVLMAVLVSIWAIRLTYNFARRGGYSWKFWTGEEDYRWPVLKARPEFAARWKWVLFNLFFISFYQMALILFFTLPALKSINSDPLGWIDILLALLFVIFLALETIADQQQWIFQREKLRVKKKNGALPEIYKNGFISYGLWKYVRHPNYAAEQAIWIVFYLFSVTATGNIFNWSITGCILLVLLFLGSSDFSESISTSKYPAYSDYKKKVPRFIPFKIQ